MPYQQGAAVAPHQRVMQLGWSGFLLPPKISVSFNRNIQNYFIFIALLCSAAWKFPTESDILAAVTQRRRGYATIPTWDQQKRVRSLDLKAGKMGFPALNRKMWLHRPQLGEPVWERQKHLQP